MTKQAKDDKVARSSTTRGTGAYLMGGLGLLVGFVAGMGFSAYASGFGSPAPTNLAAEVEGSRQLPAPRLVDTEGRPSRGPEDAPITIVEFTDYECPYCRRHFDNTIPEIRARFGDEVRYVVRNFPLRSIHPHAQKAAEAAECAFEQGKFWEYHDILFSNPRALTVGDLKEHASSIGLSRPTFDECLDSGRMAPVVERDLREALMQGLSSTPAFIINGYALIGAQPIDAFEAYIETLLGRR